MAVANHADANGANPTTDLLVRNAALADWVYHRGDEDQAFSLGEIGEGLAILQLAADTKAGPLALEYGFTFGDDGFIYNKATGFAAAIVVSQGVYTIVFRGTDLATDNPYKIAAAATGGSSNGEVDALDVQQDIALGNSTLLTSGQAIDAFNVVKLLQAIAIPLGNINAVGQSLGGGLAGLVSAFYGVKATLLDPAPFAGHINALAARAALDVVKDYNGHPLIVESTTVALIAQEILQTYGDSVYDRFISSFGQYRSEYNNNVSNNANAHLVRDELLTNPLTLGILSLFGAQHFLTSKTIFDAGPAAGPSAALALHNPTLLALIARSVSQEGGDRSFADLLKNDEFLRKVFTGPDSGIAGAKNHARSDLADTTSKVTSTGAEVGILERAFFKSIGSEVDIYRIFYDLFDTTLKSGAVSETADNALLPSIYDGVGKLVLGVMRDVVANTTTLDAVRDKLHNIDFSFSGKTSTDFDASGSQEKVVVKLSDITGTDKLYKGADGLPFGVMDLNRAILEKMMDGSDQRTVEKLLERSFADIFGANAKGLDWKVLVAQAGRDGANLDYMASEAENQVDGQSHLILGGDGDDKLGGSSVRDFILGGDGKDRLLGGRGDDILVGGGGEDIIDGGSGNSVYKGGEGADTFVIGAHMGRVDIMDAGAGDRLVLRLAGVDGMPSTGYVLAGGLVSPFADDTNQKIATFRSIQYKYNIEIDPSNDILTSPSRETYYVEGTSEENEFTITYTLDIAQKLLDIKVEQFGVENGAFHVRIPDFTEGMLGLRFETEYELITDDPYIPLDEALVLHRAFAEKLGAQAKAFVDATKIVDLPDTLDESGENGSANRFVAQITAQADEGRNDTVIVGARDDVLYGYGGNDTYVYSSSAAHNVRIKDTAYRSYDNSADKLRLEGLTAADVSISRLDELSDAVVTVKATGAVITLSGEFGSSTVEEIEFDDGVVLDLDGIQQATIDYALTDAGTSIAFGFDDRDDVFVAGSQAKTLVGLSGDDTYRYTAAGGADIVVRDNWFGIPSMDDKLVLVDLNPGDVTISREDGSEDAVLTVVASGRTIMLTGQFAGGAIETVVFADGTTWSADGIQQLLLDQESFAGGDTIYGFDRRDDTLIADGRHAKLVGYGGADTYLYAASTEADIRIADQPSYGDDSAGDVLTFTDITSGDVTVAQPDGGLDAVLTITASGRTLTLEGQFGGGEIETIRFADGMSWSAAQIRQMILAVPNAAASGTVYGFYNGDDELRAGSGNKTLVGYGGSDTYLYTAATDGNLTVADRSYDPNGLETDVLRFTDANETGVVVTRTGSSGDAVLRILSTGKTIVLQDQFTYYPIEQVAFADGSTWSAAQIREKVLAQANATGSGSTHGFEASDDTLLAGSGRKTLTGYSGGDTYVFENGVHGNTVIADQGFDRSVDKLILKGVAPTAVSASSPDQSGTVVLTLAPHGTTVTIQGQLGGTGVEVVQFDNGTTWTADYIEELIYGPRNKAPTAPALTLNGTEDTPLTLSAAQILANAGDPDGDPLMLSSVQGASNGTVSLAADGSIVFTPDADFAGRAGFTYTVADGRGGSATGQVTLDLSGVNDAPTVSSSPLRVREDAPAAGRVASSDVDGDALSFVVKTGAGPTKGQVDLSVDGSFLYTPTANLNGSDAFTVVVSDGNGGSTEVVVSVQIAPRNDAPTAAAGPESSAFETDGTATGTLLAGADVDGDALTFRIVEGSAYGGTVELDATTGAYVFTADAGYVGPARFAYVVSDGSLESSIKFVDIAIRSDNSAPTVAATMMIQTNEDVTVAGRVAATDSDGDALAYTIKNGAGPTKGTVAFGTGGAFTYKPIANLNGSDAFTVVVSDGHGGTAEQVVSVTIAAVNDAPTAAATSSIRTTEDNAVSGRVVAADIDGDAVTYAVKSGAGPAKGTVAFDSGGTFTYTPATNANGSDIFTVVVSDGHGGTAEQVVSVSIEAVNDAPTAAASSSIHTTEDTAVSGRVAATDVDGDALIYAIKSGAGPAKGSVSFGQDGEFTYTPIANANGTDIFTVVVSDGSGGSTEQVVSVSIEAVNDAPTAEASSSLQVTEDTVATGVIAAVDVDGDALSYAIKSGAGPAKGSVTFGTKGAFTYTPAANVNGSDSFTVMVSDGYGGSVEQSVSVSIAAVNDAPTPVADVGNAGENETKVFDLMANDTDVDAGDTKSLVSFTVTSVTGVPGGLTTNSAQSAFSIQGNKLNFAPGTQFDALASGQNATVAVDYVIEDAAQARSTGNFTLTVVGADEAVAGPTSGADTLYGTASADTVHGLGGDDVLWGRDGDDLLYGDAGNDQLNGEAGNDLLDGGIGDDAMVGGAGNDVYYVDSAADTITEAASGGSDEVRTTLSSYTLGTELEKLTYLGAAAFTGNGNTLANTLTGGAGADKLTGGAGNDVYLGLGGNDIFYGGAGADTHNGGDGFDTVDYGSAGSAIVVDLATPTNNTGDAAGDTFQFVEQFGLSGFNDRFVGSGGVDYVYAQGGNDTLLGGAGDDWLAGAAGSDLLDGQDGFDTADYTGASAAVVVDRVTAANSSGDAKGDTFTSIERFHLSQFNDRFVGSTANEFIYGNGGNDTLLGGDGNDWLIGGTGADALTGGNGYDYASYFSASASVVINRVTAANSSGEAAGDTFTTIEAWQLTASYADQFIGSSAAETVYGGGGNDVLSGNSGNDFLDGEEQNDTLTGGAGTDTFAFYERGFGKDVVTDFVTGDLIEFSSSAFADFTAVKSKMSQVGANTVINLDVDNSVTLQNVTAANLKAADFHFV